MGFIGILLLVIFGISAILLIIVVLLQDDQGEGIGGLFGGGGSSSFGARSGNALTKFTSILGAVFITCSFGLAFLNKTPEQDTLLKKAQQEQAQEQFNWWETEMENETNESENDAIQSTE